MASQGNFMFRQNAYGFSAVQGQIRTATEQRQTKEKGAIQSFTGFCGNNEKHVKAVHSTEFKTYKK